MPSASLIRGVSLGGWLVLEAFITPSYFDRANEIVRSGAATGGPCPGLIVDQWSLHECLGSNRSLELLAPHWKSFVTYADLLQLRAAGINTVRIPVPYWLVDVRPGEPWVGQEQMVGALRQVIHWSAELGLKVFVDLHAAPGSQNGFDNSGRVGHTDWLLADSTGLPNLRRTLVVWQKLVALLGDMARTAGVPLDELLVGLEVINEAPWFDANIDRDVLRAFIVEAYFLLRGLLGSEKVPIYFHDGFLPHAWADFMQGARFRNANVRLDRHEYQTFDQGEVRWPASKHIRLACEQAFSIEQNMLTRPTVVGEFSVATNDCDAHLNGYGKGSRYEGTPPFATDLPPVGSCEPLRRAADFTKSYRTYLRQYAEAQMQSWDVGLGWIYWNFKTENGCAPHFDYLLGVEQGYLPPVAGVYEHLCPSYMRRTMV